MAQLDLVVGDLDANVAAIVSSLAAAEDAGADVCLFPELAVTGYPPEDLLMKPRFLAENQAALEEVAASSRRCVAVVGFVELGDDQPPAFRGDGGGTRPPLQLANAAAICAGGSVIGVYRKRFLPNYGVFDEKRWFDPGTGSLPLYGVGGAALGVSICEDIWDPEGTVVGLGRGGADLVVNINASPFAHGRFDERLSLLRRRVAEAGCPIAYCNLVGGQDELVFDGASVVVGADGSLLAAAAQFAEELLVVDLDLEHRDAVRTLGVVPVTGPPPGRAPLPTPPVRSPLSATAEVYEALVLGTRDYLAKNEFGDVVIALSGGIDSSIVAAIAVDAVGADCVHALSMPSRYSSEGSVADAKELADRLGIGLTVVPIEPAHRALASVLGAVLEGEPSGLTDENLQSRLRGILLMAVSNSIKRSIVLTTGNKSEIATGYFTLYGDAVGGFAAIKDVAKTEVYELCRYRNARPGPPPLDPIPASILDKPPSAELRPDQRDDQSLPPYAVLDPILEAYVERDRTEPEMVAEGFDPDVVNAVVRLVDTAEYKRRQLAPGVRITAKAFGKDRRVPITNRYRAAEAPRQRPPKR
jgi:NAD+ synthase (glutamine-hydrolysing)